MLMSYDCSVGYDWLENKIPSMHEKHAAPVPTTTTTTTTTT
jgi:hypothetical protein